MSRSTRASPGERTRAALVCLWLRDPAVEVLLLDEPTDQLDRPGITALEGALAAWPGGLVVCLDRIGAAQRLELGPTCSAR